MKKIISLTFLFVSSLLLVACSEKEEPLTRVDVQQVNEEGNAGEVVMITAQEKIDMISKSLKHVKWEPNTKVSMARKEDVFATLFYTYDENMPERPYEYRIWFNENETAEIISNNEKEGYGTLDKENSQNLKNALLK